MTLTNEQKVRRFEKALAQAGNTHSISDVMQRIEQNRACCWTNGDSVVVTEVLMFPRLRAVNYWLVSGKLQECAALQPDIDAWQRFFKNKSSYGSRTFGGWFGYLFPYVKDHNNPSRDSYW